MNKNKLSDARYVDYRETSLDMTIQGLDSSINRLAKKIKTQNFYDVDWFLEESEPIYELAFIAFQNYINKSIKDATGSTHSKTKAYALDSKIEGYSRTRIELIIGLANYAKHKEEETLHTGTQKILSSFKLDFDDIVYLDRSAIFQGLSLLDANWNLFEIKKNVTDWREKLWINQPGNNNISI